MKSFIQFLKESYYQKILTEGKHWNQYLNQFKDIIEKKLKNVSWFTPEFIDNEFFYVDDKYRNDLSADEKKKWENSISKILEPLRHESSSNGYIAPIARWLTEYVGTNQEKYNEFKNEILSKIIEVLRSIPLKTPEDKQRKIEIQQKWSYKDFENYKKELENKIKVDQEEKAKGFKEKDNGYTLVPIYSYEELNKRYSGLKTGGWRKSKYWMVPHKWKINL